MERISKSKLARLLEVSLRDVEDYLLEQGLPPIGYGEVEISTA